MDDFRTRFAARRLSIIARVSCAALLTTACASTPTAHSVRSFDGEWGVEWCDKTAPELDCGGFHVRLVQAGERICGSCSGALVGLRQIDEGGARAILGTVSDDTANLTIRSGRSGAIYKVRAIEGHFHVVG